ncbi:polysaccharide deacetylase [Rippkaea orientalis PCC 8801]|uniref:Polysaccharide deacetylase n=1 Tax=Rippkaea orientalis (strain PCC 8801 / RF-1) TaxID=41431 RepID=B7JYI3_RIPO1|nr:polysaccharide deacetylase family protein [Rippkaea orientalis]ACK64853.1 polysaccharide deacetylase [Rippkaea orientalis PCC 8801]
MNSRTLQTIRSLFIEITVIVASLAVMMNSLAVPNNLTPQDNAKTLIQNLSQKTVSDFSLDSSASLSPNLKTNGKYSALKRIDVTFKNRNYWIAQIPNKTVVLTFDDGPSPDYTPKILKKLAQYNIKATFFVVGHRVEHHCDLVRQIVDKGHELGNHTYSHRNLTQLSAKQQEQEIAKTQEAIRKCVGETHVPKWFRAPYGVQNQITFTILKKLNLSSVLWSVDTNDWRIQSTSQTIANDVIASHGKGIVLMHDGVFNSNATVSNRNATVNALDLFLQPMIDQKIQFVTLSKALSPEKTE